MAIDIVLPTFFFFLFIENIVFFVEEYWIGVEIDSGMNEIQIAVLWLEYCHDQNYGFDRNIHNIVRGHNSHL